MEEIFNPKVLILQREADCTAASFIANEMGTLAYDNNTNKLAFVTSAGVSAEQVTSA